MSMLFSTHTESGVYFDTLQIGSICESFTEIHLTVLWPSNIAIDTSICEGEYYLGYDSTGVFSYDSINPVTGCTDLVTLNLEVIPLGMAQCITGTREIDAVVIVFIRILCRRRYTSRHQQTSLQYVYTR